MSRRSKSARVRAYLLRNYQNCFCCGKKLYSVSNATVEHIIPASVYMWATEDTVLSNQTRRAKSSSYLVEDERNLKLSHHKCNAKKGSFYSCNIMDYFDIYGSTQLGGDFEAFFWESLPYLEKYDALVNKVLEDRVTCNICGKELSKDNIVFRRIDSSKERSLDNAVCLCTGESCNSTYRRAKQVLKNIV